jgi:class 3 adenylate cyclase/predicted ATPase
MTVCSSCRADNPANAKFCNECGAALAVAAPREQRKTVTVLFCDVSGSTSLAERVDPEALRAIMARYFDVARTAIERHGGTVEKFIGDAVMAVFGIPIVHEDDALRAVRAALELRDAVEIDVRIGVNTGEVVTGGGDTLATGDAVNVAARLEQAAGTGEVLLGEQTYALVRDAVDVELLPPLEAKGKSEPLTAYRLRSVTGGAGRRDAAPMVGRAAELELLGRAYERTVREHACHLFTILGTAGIGKSRLVSEFLAGLQHARVVHGRCLSYGEGITYWPVVEVLKQLGTSVESVFREGTTPPEIAWDVRRSLEHAALDGALVVVFDDIQWGEATFLDLIEHVADLSRGAPILLLCMARPELLDVRPGWAGGKHNATTVLLEPLPRDAVDELLVALAGEVDERIREAADGNPLFVEEMVELARMRGGDVAVPPTIQALLTARLDSLPEAERAVLERGAVEGQVFHRNAVAALAPEEPQVDTRLVSLVRKELVRPDQAALPRDDAYRFRHLLIRDAAYEALPKATRIDLHERFATWLEEHGADLVELDEIVGYHLEQAARYAVELGRPSRGLAARAAARLEAAAFRAEARGDGSATLNLVERAVGLRETDDPRRLSLLPTLGRALGESGRLAEATAVLGEAVERGDARTSARARAIRAVTSFGHDPEALHESRLREIERAIGELAGLGDDTALAEAYVARAKILIWAGRMSDAGADAERALVHAERCSDLRAEIQARGMWLRAQEASDAPRAHVEASAQALLDDPRLGPAVQTRALAVLSRCSYMRGAFADSERLHEEQGRRLKELGFEVDAAAISMYAGFRRWLQRDWRAMEREARSGWDRLGELGEVGYRSTCGAALAVALAWLRRDEEAAAIADAADAMTSPDDYVTLAWTAAARSRVALNAGDVGRAVDFAREAVRLTETREDVPDGAFALTVLAEALALVGETGEAEQRVRELEELVERSGSLAFVERARAVLATMPA